MRWKRRRPLFKDIHPQRLQVMECSRIFVKGLPPNLSLEDFRQHFSKQSAITDARFIPHRRIGYVGYKTPEDAVKAVKYHNKSFIRMSKIGVELARSVEDQYALGVGINFGNRSKREYADVQEHGPSDTRNDGKNKRKREDPAEPGDKTKLFEFLEVMRPPSKSKIWENQDAEVSQVSSRPTPRDGDAMIQAARNEDIYEQLPKMGNNERQNEVENVLSAGPPVPVDVSSMDARKLSTNSDLSQELIQEPLAKSLAVSDDDWLRSRTSRLLGLMDDDDIQHTAKPKDAPTVGAGPSEVPEQSKEGSVSDAIVHTNERSRVEQPALETETVGNGRLFVRNLTYTTTQEDLRKHFEDHGHGNTEEVSLGLYNPHYFLWSDSCDEHPDRDSLCFTCDVTRKSVLVDTSLL